MVVNINNFSKNYQFKIQKYLFELKYINKHYTMYSEEFYKFFNENA